MATTQSKSPRAAGSPTPAAAKQPDAAAPRSWLGWIVGWVLTPIVCLTAIVGGGVYVGANHPDAWLSQAVAWLVDKL